MVINMHAQAHHILGPIYADCALAAPAVAIGAGAAIAAKSMHGHGRSPNKEHPRPVYNPQQQQAYVQRPTLAEHRCNGILLGENRCFSQQEWQNMIANGRQFPKSYCPYITCQQFDKLDLSFHQSVAENCDETLMRLRCATFRRQLQALPTKEPRLVDGPTNFIPPPKRIQTGPPQEITGSSARGVGSNEQDGAVASKNEQHGEHKTTGGCMPLLAPDFLATTRREDGQSSWKNKEEMKRFF